MIRIVRRADSSAFAKIHIAALGGDFLPSLGFSFLKTFYNGVINTFGVYGFVYEEDGKVHGFVVGTRNSSKFFRRAIRANFIRFSFLLFVALIKKPTIIKNIFETFLYPKKDVGAKAELVVIAVDNKYRGKGIGKRLVLALEEEFKNRKITSYKLTVHASKEAVGFYEHLGYSRISSFRLYDKMWYVYEKKIR